MPSIEHVLITGANRGIGLGIVQEYLKLSNTHIFATCRNPETARELLKLSEDNPGRVTIVELDLSDFSSIERSFKTYPRTNRWTRYCYQQCCHAFSQ